VGGCQLNPNEKQPLFEPGVFDAERAYEDVVTQVGIGPRFSGSEGHAKIREWLVESLGIAGWQAEVIEASYQNYAIYNIEACRDGAGAPEEGYVLIGAHYDTRIYADNDPDPSQRSQPVIGANDGGSGVAVLLELARVLPAEHSKRVCLVFFDAEDNGRILDWDWAVGSRAYVEQLVDYPEAVVIVDMVGDFDQYFPLEQTSDPALAAEIWGTAARLGIESFVQEPGKSILDDHTPFIQKGIPAVDIIDIDYPYWHTVEDTADKVSQQSLKNVGDVLLAWLLDN
jgi:Zn-dependent M28 family amino/carboxypeptidase